jgi:hypothetical protein
VSLTIAILVTATAIPDGDVYRVALEVAAAPLYRVMDVSAIGCYSCSFIGVGVGITGGFGFVNIPFSYKYPTEGAFSLVYSMQVRPVTSSAIANESATMQFSTIPLLITANVATIYIPFVTNIVVCKN